MPTFSKPSAATLEVFGQASGSFPGAEKRTMFGYPALFVNGNMMACVFQDRIMVRLSEADRSEVLTSLGGKLFEPSPGRAMREYVELPPGLASDPAALRAWFQRAHAFVGAMPAKKSKSRKK